MKLQILSLAFIVVASLGCDDEEPPIDPSNNIEFAVGAADEEGRFIEMNDGDPIVMEAGAQGGFHIWTKVRIKGVSETVYLDRQIRRVSDDLLVLRANREVFDLPAPTKDITFEPNRQLANFMCPTPIGVEIENQDLYLTTRLISEDEELLSEDVVQFTPLCPEDSTEEFCKSICNG